MTRIDRDELNMLIARLMARRGTCARAQVGCVITHEGRIIATGYNGSPSGMPHCIDVGCKMENGHCIATIHAEAGAISFAAKNGIALKGSTMYVTMAPCLNCAKLIINSGIKKIIIDKPYSSEQGLDLLYEAGIDIYLVGGGKRLWNKYARIVTYQKTLL